jgi:mono/diheme cytochrome c family protein
MQARIFSVVSPLLFAAVATAAPANLQVDFDRAVRPILSDNCFTCHGPDSTKRMVGLHFDTKEGAFGKPGVIVPGDSAHSKMFLRISNPNEAMRMPPVSSGHKLTPAQIETIKTWIDTGAKWETHWSFAPPVRPELPAVKNESWPRTPIDRFILARLEKESLAPSPETDKATLLRRVTFDLTGLPPTLAELKNFLADNSPTAYEKVVDRLLASPHYGERMSVPWLDLARYSDTHGYHIDSAREMWPWRDWVINAFNQNMPYDQFSLEQLAGDLLPNATQSQIIATGFNRNHMINFEGGAIPEEYQNEYIVDRIEATSTTWLGITLGCARCHDHKYDPLTQKDFYSFGAFFNAVPEEGLDGYKGNAKPFLQLPNAQQTATKDLLSKFIKQKDEQLFDAQFAWERQQREMPVSDVTAGLTAEFPFDDSLADRLHADVSPKLLNGKLEYVNGLAARAADFDAEPQVSFGPSVGTLSTNKPFTLAFWIKADGPSGMSILQHRAPNVAQTLVSAAPRLVSALGSVPSPTYEIALDYCAKNTCNVIVKMEDPSSHSAIEIKSQKGATLESWSHLTITYDGSNHAKGIQIFVDGQPIPIDIIRDQLTTPITFNTGELQIGNKDWGTPFKGQLSDLRFYDRRLYSNEVSELAVATPLHKIIDVPVARRTEPQQKWLRDYFVANVANPLEKQEKQDLATLRRGFDQLNREITSTMVMSDMAKPRDTFVLKRGDYRLAADKVLPNTPIVLPALPSDAPRNRLTLAKWIIDPANPLTARVAVNHFWQMYFGVGLVKTAEDFGSQGDPPANQDLLDWLATEFVQSKWDVKAMQKLIVTSAVYRQSSRVTPELFEKDPENRLIAHGPRFRLPAEMIRDNALFVSGLITDKIGGPSVLPYQPKGLWEEMAFGGDFSAQTYVQSHGADLYRRSMYTFVKRTVPYPGLNTFDAPDREKCTARRTITNTPLQALLLMNDPTYLEASRALAQRSLPQSDRVRWIFHLVTDRDPSAQETAILTKLYEKEHARYADHKDAAQKLITIGESKPDPLADPADLAAWTMVASTILNMDETVTKN